MASRILFVLLVIMLILCLVVNNNVHCVIHSSVVYRGSMLDYWIKCLVNKGVASKCKFCL